VPPFLKLAYGPLLGPGMLVAAGRRAGHEVRLCDLNAAWIRERLPCDAPPARRELLGDHDRPDALAEMHDEFKRDLALHEARDTHEAVFDTAHQLVTSAFGAWAAAKMAPHTSPDVVGVSVMYRDQVEPALAVTLIARRLWPRALIVWGGAHVTALRDDIVIDARYGGGVIDRFVFGYAEQTWAEMLDAIARHAPLPEEVACAGCGRWLPARDDGSVVPVFDELSLYDAASLTLPMQSSRGCTYGKCAFCTYPSIEGKPRDIPWPALDQVIERAIVLRAAISFKDSLVEGKRLETIAQRIAGHTVWSACTKLDAHLPDRLFRLAAGGCRTLEIGLETLHRGTQNLILKRQNETTFHAFLDAAALAKIAVVVNYMTGLPHVDREEELRCKAMAEHAMRARPTLVSKQEHNTFQLERLSPMAHAPESYGLRITKRASWSSVLSWEPCLLGRDLSLRRKLQVRANAAP
jgi:hypothetical protein